MATVIAHFDGQNFVPEQPVNVPVGTKVVIPLPVASAAPSAIPPPPREPTDEELADWQEFMPELDATEPYFPTVEDALRYSRKYP